jgi:hypothetical protein
MKLVTMKKISLVALSTLLSILAFAQEKDIDINVNKDGGNNFWGSPWVWVIGAAIFILLLAAILRPKSAE